MASGDVIVFDSFEVDRGGKLHNLNGDTWKFALITSAVTPVDSDTNPRFVATGNPDHSATEVTPGGNYTAGGITLTNVTYTNAAGLVDWRADKVLIAQDNANPTNARWGIIYNDTLASKRCAVFCDLGSVLDLTLGPFEFRFGQIDGNGSILRTTVN